MVAPDGKIYERRNNAVKNESKSFQFVKNNVVDLYDCMYFIAVFHLVSIYFRSIYCNESEKIVKKN